MPEKRCPIRFYTKNPDVVFRKVADECILVPVRSNPASPASIYTLNELSARIWELIDGKISVQRIAAMISQEYEVSEKEAESDLLGFLRQLEEAGCIRALS